jgi:uncharacterized protein YqcC (DUF446 family)
MQHADVTPADRDAYAAVADRIETELRALGAWSTAEAPPEPAGAFGAPNLSFSQWLQFTLLPRMRAIAQGTAEPPAESNAGARAVREYDGYDAADPLVLALLDLDELVNDR